jgi:hypothetical protein
MMQTGVVQNNSNNRILRIIKILRMLKIIRLLKSVKVVECVPLQHLSAWESDLYRLEIGSNLKNPDGHLLNQLMLNRVIEDYAVVFFGSATFKMLRLVAFAAFSVHLFACIFYRVKDSSEDPESVVAFFESREAAIDVSSQSMFSLVRMEGEVYFVYEYTF